LTGINIPSCAMYLDALVGGQELWSGDTPRIGDSFIACVAIEGFPATSWPFMTEVHDRVPVAHRFSSRFIALDQHEALDHQAKSLSFTAADLDGQFAKKYGDYNSYVRDQIGDEALSAKLQQWSEDTNSSVLTTLKAAGLSNAQIAGEEDSYLRSLETLAETAEGRMQAIQVGNQIALAGARQTQKLRQIMLVEVQLLANFVQRQNDRDTAEAAAWRNAAKTLDLSTSNGKRF